MRHGRHIGITAALTLVLALGAAGNAVAAPAVAVAELDHACANKLTGLMRAVASTSECVQRSETAVTFSDAAPINACEIGGYLAKTPPGICWGRRVFQLPSSTQTFLCAVTSSRNMLRLASAPSACASFEIPYVIGSHAPTDIALSPASVAENQAAVTTVGSLSATDADAGDTHTFSLVSGVGDTNNGSFTIDGTTLKTSASFDHEAGGARSIRVRAVDGSGRAYEEQLTVTVTNVNEGPTTIDLAGDTLQENLGAGTTVGTLSADDPDAGDTHTFTLVSGPGDADNGSFVIVGSTLRADTLDYETRPTRSIRVQVRDAGGLTHVEQFTIFVTNANEAPTGISLSPASVAENQPAGTTVGTLSVTDPDTADVFAFSLLPGSFAVVGNTIQTTAPLNFEAGSTRSIRVQVTDSGGLSHQEDLTITVTNVVDEPNAAPTADCPGSFVTIGGSRVLPAMGGSDPDGDALTWIVTVLPTKVDLYDAVTGGQITSVPHTLAGNQLRAVSTHHLVDSDFASWLGPDDYKIKTSDGVAQSPEANCDFTVDSGGGGGR